MLRLLIEVIFLLVPTSLLEATSFRLVQDRTSQCFFRHGMWN